MVRQWAGKSPAFPFLPRGYHWTSASAVSFFFCTPAKGELANRNWEGLFLFLRKRSTQLWVFPALETILSVKTEMEGSKLNVEIPIERPGLFSSFSWAHSTQQHPTSKLYLALLGRKSVQEYISLCVETELP